MIAKVEVAVAVARPPSAEHTRLVWVVVAGESETDCELAACQIAQASRPAVVYAVGSRITELLEV